MPVITVSFVCDHCSKPASAPVTVPDRTDVAKVVKAEPTTAFVRCPHCQKLVLVDLQ